VRLCIYKAPFSARGRAAKIEFAPSKQQMSIQNKTKFDLETIRKFPKMERRMVWTTTTKMSIENAHKMVEFHRLSGFYVRRIEMDEYALWLRDFIEYSQPISAIIETPECYWVICWDAGVRLW
jgi:hypothetical protein